MAVLINFIFLLSIAFQVDLAISVCMNAHISALMKARYAKFVIQLTLYHKFLIFILNLGCHAQCLGKYIFYVYTAKY